MIARVLLKPIHVKHYDVISNGRRNDALPEDEVARLFASGALHRRSPCRPYGTDEWKNIGECLPHLQRTSPSPSPESPSPSGPRTSSAPPHTSDPDERRPPAKKTALRLGWICFTLGLLAAWFFPPAYFLFTVAIVTSIVAMCTSRVTPGLILLLSSFLGLAASLVLSFSLSVGLFAPVAGPPPVQVQAATPRSTPPPASPPPRLAAQPTAPPATPLPSPSVAPAPHVRTAVPIYVPVATPPKAITSVTQHELFVEIAQIEKEQRDLRAQGRNLPPEAQARLDQLRAAR